MRVITGKYKGRRLFTPVGEEVRPTSDKVKEAIFNILMTVTEGAVCLDLFAGTGNIGIEALSRGAKRCYFCDNSRDSVALIKKNLEHVGAKEDARVIAGDYNKALRTVREKVDIFFIDPPYDAGLYEKVLKAIDSLDLSASEGIIIAEHDKYADIPERVGSFVFAARHRYGKTYVSVFEKREEI